MDPTSVELHYTIPHSSPYSEDNLPVNSQDLHLQVSGIVLLAKNSLQEISTLEVIDAAHFDFSTLDDSVSTQNLDLFKQSYLNYYKKNPDDFRRKVNTVLSSYLFKKWQDTWYVGCEYDESCFFIQAFALMQEEGEVISFSYLKESIEKGELGFIYGSPGYCLMSWLASQSPSTNFRYELMTEISLNRYSEFMLSPPNGPAPLVLRLIDDFVASYGQTIMTPEEKEQRLQQFAERFEAHIQHIASHLYFPMNGQRIQLGINSTFADVVNIYFTQRLLVSENPLQDLQTFHEEYLPVLRALGCEFSEIDLRRYDMLIQVLSCVNQDEGKIDVQRFRSIYNQLRGEELTILGSSEELPVLQLSESYGAVKVLPNLKIVDLLPHQFFSLIGQNHQIWISDYLPVMRTMNPPEILEFMNAFIIEYQKDSSKKEPSDAFKIFASTYYMYNIIAKKAGRETSPWAEAKKAGNTQALLLFAQFGVPEQS